VDAARATASGPERTARRSISRTADREITFAGVALAALFVGLALASIALPVGDRRGLWLPLHLGLAGAAGTAIAAVLPFFTAALAVARPVRPAIRVAGVGLVATGALAASIGVAGGPASLAVGGGVLYLAGLATVAAAAFLPLRAALGPRRRLIEGAYIAAITQVVVGVALVTAMLAGSETVVERWDGLKPAHAWLNVFGFLSVIVAATLLHLAPTVAGTRIKPRTSARLAVIGLASGAPLVALGMGTGSDAIARLGALIEIAGAVALVAHGLAVHRDRGRWTTDPAWHRLTGWSLLAAPGWFFVAVMIAAGRVLWLGAAPAAWSMDLVAPPLVLGWLAQTLVGSWTHLVPAIGPGDQAAHAIQRRMLGRAATARWTTLNAGVAATVLGIALGAPPLAVAGVIFAVLSVAVAVGLLLVAVLLPRVTSTRGAAGG
jgi:nitrite reductase (NO-forming)